MECVQETVVILSDDERERLKRYAKSVSTINPDLARQLRSVAAISRLRASDVLTLRAMLAMADDAYETDDEDERDELMGGHLAAWSIIDQAVDELTKLRTEPRAEAVRCVVLPDGIYDALALYQHAAPDTEHRAAFQRIIGERSVREDRDAQLVLDTLGYHIAEQRDDADTLILFMRRAILALIAH